MLNDAALQDALAPARAALRVTVACAAVLAIVVLAVAGPTAAAGVAMGAAAGLLGGGLLSAGLSIAFAHRDDAPAARRLAVIAALVRYPAIAAVLALAILAWRLPASWVCAGLAAWPISLIAAALRDRSRRAPSASRA